MADKSISQLSPGVAVTDTDLLPNVQVVGVGPVKTTAVQIKTYVNTDPNITGVIKAQLGSAAAPSYTFDGDLNTGWWSPAADTLAASTGGTERIRLNSSGNVGIATTNPQRPLHVKYSSAVVAQHSVVLEAAQGGYGTGISLQSPLNVSGALAEMARIVADGQNSWSSADASTQDAYLSFYTALDGTSAEKMRINAAGNVGIGTTSPAGKLHVSGGSQYITSGDLWIATTARKVGWDVSGVYYNWIESDGVAGNAFMRFAVSNAEAMRILTNGNVGIGTTSPAYRFHAVTTSGAIGAFRGTSAANSYLLVGNTAGDLVIQANASGDAFLYSDAGKYLAFGTNGGSEHMRITSTGNVGIGQTSVTAVFGRTVSVTGGGGATLRTSGSTVSAYLYSSDGFGLSGLVSETNHPLVLSTNSVERVRIDTAGNVGIGTTSPSGKLEVAGNNTSIYLRSNDTNDATLRYFVNSVEVATARGKSGNIYAIETGGTERMRITSAGNVGIGTTSPLTPLQVGSVAYSSSFFGLTGGNAFIAGANVTPSKTQRGNLHIETTNVSASGVGPAITFGLNSSQFVDDYVVVAGSIKTQVVGTGNVVPEPAMVFSLLSPQNATTATLTERMRIDSAGNVGVGVTPNAWSGYKAIQFAVGRGFVASSDSAFRFNAGTNAYYNGTNWIYAASTFASMYSQDGSIHAWFTAPSGTAGNVISFTQAMTLDASGNLGVGTTSPQARVDVSGAARVSGTSTFTSGAGLEIQYSTGTNTSTVRSYDRTAAIHRNLITYALNHSFYIDDANEVLKVTSSKSVVVNNAAVATNATDGFLYVPGCAGTPTGVPTAFTGRVPIVVDTTNNKLYFYSGGAWRDAGP